MGASKHRRRQMVEELRLRDEGTGAAIAFEFMGIKAEPGTPVDRREVENTEAWGWQERQVMKYGPW